MASRSAGAQLNDVDLDRLPSVHDRESYYRRAAFARVYLVSDVKRAADLKRVLGISNVTRKAAKVKLPIKPFEPAPSKSPWRQDRLVAALKAKGLELRADSRLCQGFLDGTGDLSLDEVVDRMMTMHLLYEHARYPYHHESAYQAAQRDMRLDMQLEGCARCLSVLGDFLNVSTSACGPFLDYFEPAKVEAEADALAELATLESKEEYADAEACECGKRKLRHLLGTEK